MQKLASCAALLVLCAPTGAQSNSTKIFRRYSKPLRTASLNLETGTITRGPRVLEQAVVTTVDFSNIDLAGFIAVDTTGCEWLDVGTKGNGAGPSSGGPVPSNLVESFVFAYCSAALSTLSGGPGGTMTWTFYPSHTTGVLHPATSNVVGAFTLTSLPANTFAGAVFAQISCYFFEVTFGSLPLPFPDGPFGYSWTLDDVDSAGIFGATLPFLACVTSCSGVGPDGQGMTDYLDQYCPGGIPGSVPFTSFCFSTSGVCLPTMSSINLELRELDVPASIAPVAPDLGLNIDLLSTSSVVIGGTWAATLTPSPGPGPVRSSLPVASWTIFLTDAFSAPGVAVDVGTLAGLTPAPMSELHGTGAPFLGLAPIPAGLHGGTGSVATFSTTVPLTTVLLCLPWTAQAIVLGDVAGDGAPAGSEVDPMFSTAVSGLVGSH